MYAETESGSKLTRRDSYSGSQVESRHIQLVGDTGVGKTSVILQILMQIREKGDSAIVYDPALEYTERFYDPRQDIILNPLDKRCPYWGPAEELRRSSDGTSAGGVPFSTLARPER